MAKSKSKRREREVFVIGPFVVRYPDLYEPRLPEDAKPDAKPKYGVQVIMDDIPEELQEEFDAIVEDEFDGDFDSVRSPFRNGTKDRKQEPELYKGKWFMNCTSLNKPGVVDEMVRPILDPKKIYSGCKCKISVSAYTYDSKGNIGVGFGLNNIQFWEDGPRIGGGGTNPKDEFEPAKGVRSRRGAKDDDEEEDRSSRRSRRNRDDDDDDRGSRRRGGTRDMFS